MSAAASEDADVKYIKQLDAGNLRMGGRQRAMRTSHPADYPRGVHVDHVVSLQIVLAAIRLHYERPQHGAWTMPASDFALLRNTINQEWNFQPAGAVENNMFNRIDAQAVKMVKNRGKYCIADNEKLPASKQKKEREKTCGVFLDDVAFARFEKMRLMLKQPGAAKNKLLVEIVTKFLLEAYLTNAENTSTRIAEAVQEIEQFQKRQTELQARIDELVNNRGSIGKMVKILKKEAEQ